eukprot:Gb_22337 [translate_table: standard]
MASFSNTHRDDNLRTKIALSIKKAIWSPLEEIRVAMGKWFKPYTHCIWKMKGGDRETRVLLKKKVVEDPEIGEGRYLKFKQKEQSSCLEAVRLEENKSGSVENQSQVRIPGSYKDVCEHNFEDYNDFLEADSPLDALQSKQVKQASLSAMPRNNLDYTRTSFERETTLQAAQHIYESKDGHCHSISMINDNACSNLLKDMDDKSFLHLDSHSKGKHNMRTLNKKQGESSNGRSFLETSDACTTLMNGIAFEDKVHSSEEVRPKKVSTNTYKEPVSSDKAQKPTRQKEVQQLIDEFEDIFQNLPHGLPPDEGKERKYTGLPKWKMIELLLRIVSMKESMQRETQLISLTFLPALDADQLRRLASDVQGSPSRGNLKMPAMILHYKERHFSKILTSNGLVEESVALEKEQTMINPWTSKEREIYWENFAILGKTFSRIASFLEHKTMADCVEFYYKNHTSVSYERLKIQRDLQKQRVYFHTSMYVLSSGNKRHHDSDVISLDILGVVALATSAIDKINCVEGALQKCSRRPSGTPIVFGRMPYEGNSCGLSCHLECTLQRKNAGVVKIGQLVQLDGGDDKTWIYYAYPKSTESSKSKVRPSSMEPANGKRLERARTDGETVSSTPKSVLKENTLDKESPLSRGLSNDSGNADDSNNGNLKIKRKDAKDRSDGTRVDGRNLNDNDPNDGKSLISTFCQHTTESEVKSASSTKETKLGDAKHHWDENIAYENNMGRATNTTTFITPIALRQSNSRRGHCYDSQLLTEDCNPEQDSAESRSLGNVFISLLGFVYRSSDCICRSLDIPLVVRWTIYALHWTSHRSLECHLLASLMFINIVSHLLAGWWGAPFTHKMTFLLTVIISLGT